MTDVAEICLNFFSKATASLKKCLLSIFWCKKGNRSHDFTAHAQCRFFTFWLFCGIFRKGRARAFRKYIHLWGSHVHLRSYKGGNEEGASISGTVRPKKPNCSVLP